MMVRTLFSYSEIGGVRDFGISQSTLEEVFLKVIRDVNPTSTKDRKQTERGLISKGKGKGKLDNPEAKEQEQNVEEEVGYE